MTIRQIAETAGCSLNTVRKVGKDIYPNKRAVKSGIALDYSKDESINIMNKLPKSNYIADPHLTNIGNPTQMGNQIVPLDNSITAMLQMMQEMMKQQQDFMTAVIKEIREPLVVNQKVKPLQIEQVPEKSSRSIYVQEVNKLVKLSKSDWSAVYAAVYAEMGYVYGVKVKARANNRKVRPMDVLESDGLMGKAIAITRQMIERFENE